MVGLNEDFDTRVRALGAAAKDAGYDPKVVSGYRGPQDQARAIDQVSRKLLGRPASFAEFSRGIPGYAAPVGGSKHQLGQAVDWSNGPELAWLRQNAPRYGVEFPEALARTDSVHSEPDKSFMGPVQDPRDRQAAAAAGYDVGSPVVASSPAIPSPMALGGPKGSTPMVNGIYDGLTPDDVAGRRAMAQRLMGEATSTAPVGHWTGALARALTGLNSSLFREEASAGEKKGQASTQGFMQAAMANPQAAAASGMGNPWTAPVAQNIAGKVINNQMEQSSPAYQQQQQIRQGQIDMMPLERQKVEAQLAQIKTQTPEWRMQNAERFGIKPDSPEFRSFVVNGTLPSTGDYGKAGAVFQGPDGKFYTAQFGSDGTRKIEPVMANGQPLEPAKGVKTVDTGDGTRIISGASGADVRQIDKNIEGKEAAEARGQALGKAQADLPRVTANAERALKTIEQIRSHPGKQYGVGAIGALPGIPGTAQRGFVNLVDQAKGQTFLEAFNSLRGGGAITEAEGAKATQALARLDRAQRPEDFDAALKDLEDVVRRGLATAQSSGRTNAPVRAIPAGEVAPVGAGLPQGYSIRRLD